jgi:hypothetical protein
MFTSLPEKMKEQQPASQRNYEREKNPTRNEKSEERSPLEAEEKTFMQSLKNVWD